ncbi:molybdopterin converting factor, subunit 1 [Collimonas arenae]|uniref:Molybdopterin synthase sulfur carrier subunit n=1 Tax=Collimonas arenae TaxID=279058 RepID=A0A127PQ90_9BURK|nr:molybdopterin converting factor subunit 1 [Collimonas arenae]AMO99957.1 molybdopterin converting factor, subunit 1 [Collimonas arenae]AMP09851.1 molybdopterin converting factor, subunit 1 [Collimonas arenae]
MKIQLRFFASIREALNLSQETLEVPAAVATVGDVRAYLRARGGVWAEVLADGRALRMAFNQELASADTVLADNGEVAFFPPVTGG